MPAGELAAGERQRLDQAVRNADRMSGLRFSLYLGVAEEDARAYAERLHAALEHPETAVLVMCDPTFRRLEVVTGSSARRRLDDLACGLAVASMTSSFAAGELIDGLTAGIQQLGEAAAQPTTLHAKT